MTLNSELDVLSKEYLNVLYIIWIQLDADLIVIGF